MDAVRRQLAVAVGEHIDVRLDIAEGRSYREPLAQARFADHASTRRSRDIGRAVGGAVVHHPDRGVRQLGVELVHDGADRARFVEARDEDGDPGGVAHGGGIDRW